MPTGTTFITWGEVRAYTVVPKLTQYYIAMRRSECASAVCECGVLCVTTRDGKFERNFDFSVSYKIQNWKEPYQMRK